jgi:heme-degrading monooxygenase HmoA
MVIREWRGRAIAAEADAYPRHFHDQVLPGLRDVPGFLGASLSRRSLGERIEFLVLTRWQSIEAVRGFAGDNVSHAIVEPGAVAALVEFDPIARHYDVIEDVSA